MMTVCVRESIQGLLKSVGLRSESFETAEQFLKRMPPDSPSCLILDVSPPGISGLHFQQQLRDAGMHIPIIFVTGHGASSFVSKLRPAESDCVIARMVSASL